LKDECLLQAQGRVLDGQYLNEPFIAGMNEPIMRLFENGQSRKDRLWWQIEWDPAHWLDKVFSKYKDSCFVDCLLKRVALYHQLFRFGKMRIDEIRQMRYGQSRLKPGWLVVDDGADDEMPVNWTARELKDSVADLKKLATNAIDELEDRYENCFSDLNRLLSKCFDFARLFVGLCKEDPIRPQTEPQ
jgi:hypothetical protein